MRRVGRPQRPACRVGRDAIYANADCCRRIIQVCGSGRGWRGGGSAARGKAGKAQHGRQRRNAVRRAEARQHGQRSCKNRSSEKHTVRASVAACALAEAAARLLLL